MKNHQWISFFGCENPVAMKKFNIENPSNAEIDICGLGWFELYINGRKVSDDLFVPAWSDYEDRGDVRLKYPLNDKFDHRIYYLSYKLSEYLNPGENIIEVMLGNGWYNQYKRNVEGDLWYGKPKLCFVIKADGREICSDAETLWKPGFITDNNVYFGETQDFSMKQLDNWQKCELIKAPDSEFYLQTCPADKVIREITPVKIGEKLYDAGENISGRAKFFLNGEKAVVKYAEVLDNDGNLDFSTSGFCSWIPQIQCDTFIGSGNVCIPHFSWKGFRYFEIEGDVSDVTVQVIHTDIQQIAEFECSSGVLNFIFDAYVRSQLTNYHCGVPTDCPHRERLGYTGDGQLCADAAMTVFDSEGLYEKWLGDIADGQDKQTGHVQHTAPFYGGGGGPGGWGSAIVNVPFQMYRHFGRLDIIEKYYPNMKKWVEYMDSRSENGIVTSEEEGGWCLGDWCFPTDDKPPEGLVNTYFYIKSLERMQEISDVLNLQDDYFEKIEFLKNSFVREFYNSEENTFGKAGADAFALDIGLGDSKMLSNLNSRCNETGAFDTGIFGTDVLIDVLFSNGYGNTALKLLTSEKTNSYGSWKNMGATTLFETWSGNEEGMCSKNHPMFGACVRSFFTHILGIEIIGDRVIVCPAILDGLDSAYGKIRTKCGTVEIGYRKESGKIIFEGTSDCGAIFEFDGEPVVLDGKKRMEYELI